MKQKHIFVLDKRNFVYEKFYFSILFFSFLWSNNNFRKLELVFGFESCMATHRNIIHTSMGSQIAENPRMGKRLLISHWYNSRRVIWITVRINEECWVCSLKRTHRKCSKKKAALKNYAILNGKHCVGVSL